MSMPVMDGPAMIAALRTIAPDIRVVASSGLSDNGKYASVSGNSIVRFVPKPYTAEAILQTLREVLDADPSEGEHATSS